MNSIETTPTSYPDWSSLKGLTLDGGYELKELTANDSDRAVFSVRVLGDYSLKASAIFYAASGNSGEEQIALWQTVRSIGQRANLRMPLDIGSLLVGDSEVSYEVLEDAEETLAALLERRALSAEEATDTLRNLEQAAGELHAHALVHGCISPDQVLAMGDSIKLATESVRRIHTAPVANHIRPKYLAPESSSENLTMAADVWCLGATLFEALTQKAYKPTDEDEIEKLPNPLANAALRALEADPDYRCTLDDLGRMASGRAPLALKPKQSRPAPVSSSTPPAAMATPGPTPETLPLKFGETPEEKAAGKAVPPIAVSVVPEKPVMDRLEKLGNEPSSFSLPKLPNELPPRRPIVEEPEQKSWLWLYVAAALAIILLIFLLTRGRHQTKVAEGPAATNSAAASAKPNTAWPTRTLKPDTKTGPATVSRESGTGTPVRDGSNLKGGTIWRVVLYTYVRQEDAQRKAGLINEKHADLKAEAFSPSESGGPYLVVAGGQMTRGEAQQLKQRAVRLGMPHDTYIQNYRK